MKTTHTLESAITRVHNASANHYDDTVAIRDMRFSSLEQMTIAGQSFAVQPSAQRLLANRLRVPYSYLDRCPADLQQENGVYPEMVDCPWTPCAARWASGLNRVVQGTCPP